VTCHLVAPPRYPNAPAQVGLIDVSIKHDLSMVRTFVKVTISIAK